MRESQVVIDVHDLTADERGQILYNHLKLGRQPKGFRTRVKPHLEPVAAHPRFIPETARRLADPLFTDGLTIHRYNLEQFVEKQERFLQEVLQGLDSDSKAALALIYMRNDERWKVPLNFRNQKAARWSEWAVVLAVASRRLSLCMAVSSSTRILATILSGDSSIRPSGMLLPGC